jgi:CheY-like chemotaxis protein
MQSEFRTLEVIEPGRTASEAAERVSQTCDTKPAASSPQKPERDTIVNSVLLNYPEPPGYFGQALEDAERLLKYAAERGIGIDDDIRHDILQARAGSSAGWNPETAANLLSALSKLAAQLKPVTAESLKACCEGTRAIFRRYWVIAICLAIVIVPFSMASFVASAISSAIRTDIAIANDLTAKLRAELGPPPSVTRTAASTGGNSAISASPAVTGSDGGVIADLQQFATSIRAIDARARQLTDLIFLDLHLPDLSGDVVLQRLRAHPDTKNIPVVMVSADATPGQIQRLIELGARDYVTKPFDIPMLLAGVDEYTKPQLG